MKIEIDTTKKTITIKEPTNLREFYSSLLTVIPLNKWDEYTLITDDEKKLESSPEPIYIPYIPREPLTPYPQTPWYYTTTDGTSKSDNSKNMHLY